ncbi:class F sortase [Actinocorallia longicatena]|uniref:Class F sortase n=1 Tax=Actinocorallia longicatena TaxID=111803 RepID=A0ABP6QA21_9ACTN
MTPPERRMVAVVTAPPSRPCGFHLRRAAVPALGLVLALAGCGSGGSAREPAAASAAPSTTWSAVPGQVAVPETSVAVPDHADPKRLRIPSIGVDGSLIRLGTDASGVVVPPEVAMQAGWFGGGAQPGDPGPAVIAGHVDSKDGPGVFAKLGELKKGEEVLVEDDAGVTVRFVVDQVVTYPKDHFPTASVYGPTPDAQLRLITCGGSFDQSRGHYTSNVIVYASVR